MTASQQTMNQHLLHIKTYGKQDLPQVVLVHGIATQLTVWQKLIDELKLDYHVVALDLLGHGKSPKPTDVTYTAQTQAQAIYHSLKEYHYLRPSIFIGFSIGALVATQFCLQHPKLAQALVLVAPPVYMPQAANSHHLLDRSYQTLYQALERLPKQPTLRLITSLQRRAPWLMGENRLCEKTWYPVLSSLIHTVQNQSFASDIRQLDHCIKLHILYGALDHLVINRRIQEVVSIRQQTHLQRVLAPHAITNQYVQAISRNIEEISTQLKIDSSLVPKLTSLISEPI